ncbi:MAG: isoprenylcysteine carboxylmethyltransferase family protein [Candidatus Nomurabacteria bacterium]
MENNDKKLNNEVHHISGIIHVLLYHSYVVFLLAIVLGIISDAIFTFGKFQGSIYQIIGLLMIIIGTFIVFWAQKTTSYKKIEAQKDRDTNFFIKGPYRYTRNPTNFGLSLMSLGLGFIIGSLFSIIFVVITYFISKLIFIKRQDSILEERYGEVFNDYKKKVKNWL